MTFKKDQHVLGRITGAEYRIEHGPFANRGGSFYLVQKVNGPNAGDYSTILAEHIRPMPPQVGDVGRYCVGSGTPRVIREINNEYVVLQRVEEDTVHTRYRTVARELFDRNWEAMA